MKLRLLFCNLLGLFFLNSCISANKMDVVINKSTDPTPLWIEQDGEVNNEMSDYKNIVFRRNNIFNLALAIKQTQRFISDKFFILLSSEIQNDIHNNLKNDLKNINYYNQIMNKVIANQLIQLKFDAPKPEKIYWEYRLHKQRDGTKKYYVIWTLLLIPKKVYDKAMQVVAEEFKKSSNAELVTLGKLILDKNNKLK